MRAPAELRWGRGQRLKNDLLHGLARAAMALVGRLPLAFARALGAAVGLVGWAVARSERRRALESLRVAYPDESPRWRRRMARRCFAGLGRSAAEVCRLARLGPAARPWLLGYVGFPDQPVLDEALAGGDGAIWVTAHLGNWELLAAGLGARGYDVRPFAKESYDPRFTDLIDGWRRGIGVRTIWRGRGGVSAAVAETLESGGILGVLMDQDTRVPGAFVPFFGRAAWTPTGAAEVARTTGAPMLVGFVSRRPEGGHEIRVRPVRRPRGGASTAEDDVALTATLTAAIEEAVRERPEDWVWMHRRWRTRPRAERGEAR